MSIAPARLENKPVDQDGPAWTGRNVEPSPRYAASPAAYGYVEEEYIVSGEVDGVPYSTTVLVRKPADPDAFTGVVVLETIHEAGITVLWSFGDYIMANGHGYAAIASQKHVLDTHIKPFNPERYAGLEIPVPADAPMQRENPDRLYPGVPLVSISGEGPDGLYREKERIIRETMRQQPFSQAILTQFGRAIKSDDPDGPFWGRVNTLLLGGFSQTGFLTIDFIRYAHDAARFDDSTPIFDGYWPGGEADWDPVPPCDVPVVHAMGEGEILHYFYGTEGVNDPDRPPLGYRRADGDEPDDRYRLYEFAGGGHIDLRGAMPAESVKFFELRDGDIVSQYPVNMVYTTSLHNLVQWAAKGITAPHGDRIEFDESGTMRRDEFGNALGGIRITYVDVPAAKQMPAGDPDDSVYLTRSEFCQERPFSSQQLHELYGSHANYVSQVQQRLDELVQEGWLLPEHAEELRKEAETDHAERFSDARS
jgi:hypothetical protein